MALLLVVESYQFSRSAIHAEMAQLAASEATPPSLNILPHDSSYTWHNDPDPDGTLLLSQ